MVGADQTVKTATTNQNGVATFTGLSYQNYKLYEERITIIVNDSRYN